MPEAVEGPWLAMSYHSGPKRPHLDGQVAGNNSPVYPKAHHYWFEVAHNYEALALQAGAKGSHKAQFLESSLYCALKQECRILVFVRSFGLLIINITDGTWRLNGVSNYL